MWRFLILLPFLSLQAEITALYLCWYDDPTTTMTIHWHAPEEEDEISLTTPEDTWKTVVGQHEVVEHLLVHQVALKNLTPDTIYSFRIGNDPAVYHFRTAPAQLDEPLRFIIGGDLYQKTKLFRRMSQTVLQNHPRFVVLGGDLAYALNILSFRSSALRHWVSFFAEWKNSMIYPDGEIIPFLVVPGNHDITPDQYHLFFSLFAFPKKQLYRAVDFGSYLTLFLLDTGHFQPIEGQQTFWLDKALAARSSVPYRFAIYHEAGYPSHYSYEGAIPKKIRAHWSPLFEKYHLTAAFENHNHAYKKTYPIKEGKIDSEGVIYFGDGSWGASPRNTNNEWYLEQRARKNAILLVELTPQEAKIQPLDLLNAPLVDPISLSPNK